jgi:hypothetical protein
MKILRPQPDSRHSQRGSTVIVVMVMLAIMVICASVNLVALNTVNRELKMVEKKQMQHWQSNPTKSGNATLPNDRAKHLD